MKITRSIAENIRLGIQDAKLDLAEGDGTHAHEPVTSYAIDWSGGGAVFNRVAERAYWHTYEHALGRTG